MNQDTKIKFAREKVAEKEKRCVGKESGHVNLDG
jgi:hypothetical protein